MSKKKASKVKLVKKKVAKKAVKKQLKIKPKRNIVKDVTFAKSPVVKKSLIVYPSGERRQGIDRRSIDKIKLDSIVSILKRRGMNNREISNARKEIMLVLEH